MNNTNSRFEVPSQLLEWHRRGRRFTGRASALGIPLSPPPRYLAVVSARSGDRAHYILDVEDSVRLGRLTYVPHIQCANAALTNEVLIWRD
jgi:hypothetical protein